MKPKLKLRQIAAALAFAAIGTSAQALVLSDGGTANFSWSFDSNSGAGTLSGTGTVSADFVSSSEVDLTFTLNNTSSLTADRLTAFGFGIDPDAQSVSFSDANDGGMVDASMSSIPSLKTIEICAYGGVNCPGGSNGGIYGGASDTFTLMLTFSALGSSITLDPLGYKYQTDFGSFEFASSSTGGPPASGPVPEPGTLSLLGVILLGGAFRHMRRHQLPV